MYGSPSSNTITDAMSWYFKPSYWHCLSHVNWGSYHTAESLTALGKKVNSSMFSSMSHIHVVLLARHIPVYLPTLSALQPSFCSANLQHCSQKIDPLQATLHSKPTPSPLGNCCSVAPARPPSPSGLWDPNTAFPSKTTRAVSETLHPSAFVFVFSTTNSRVLHLRRWGRRVARRRQPVLQWRSF